MQGFTVKEVIQPLSKGRKKFTGLHCQIMQREMWVFLLNSKNICKFLYYLLLFLVFFVVFCPRITNCPYVFLRFGKEDIEGGVIFPPFLANDRAPSCEHTFYAL
jgi:hypothetical protein